MKRIVVMFFAILMLLILLFTLSGCTLKIETTDNSVSASVDEETTDTVDSIIDWITDRIDRVFVTESERKDSQVV